MFRLLERFVLVSEAELVNGLRQLHRLVRPPETLQFDRRQRSFSHLLVAGLGGPGSSGQMMAYKYRQANNVRQRNLVAVADIERHVGDDAIHAVVLVDDVIGTGGTAEQVLKELAASDRPQADYYLFALTGVPEGLTRLERSGDAHELDLAVEVARPLLEQQRPFSPGSPVFGSRDEQIAAREVVASYGKQLAPTMPLGYRDQAIMIALPDNCPNNVPPIFWSDANGWVPLFARTAR